MKIFQMLDVDYEPWGLIKVEVPSTTSEKEREILEITMCTIVQSVSQNEYQCDDYISSDELFDRICGKLNMLGYESERFFVEKINMV